MTIVLFYFDYILFAVLFDVETKIKFVPVIPTPLTLVHKVLDHNHEVYREQYTDDNDRCDERDLVIDKEDEQYGNHHKEDETFLKEIL